MERVIRALLLIARWSLISLISLGALAAIVWASERLHEFFDGSTVFSSVTEIESPDGRYKAAAYETRRTIGSVTSCTTHLFVVGANEGSNPSSWDEGDRVLAAGCDIFAADRLSKTVTWKGSDALSMKLPVLRSGMQFRERPKNSEMRITLSLRP